MTSPDLKFQQLPPAFCTRLLTLAALGDMLRDDATVEVYLRVADTLAIDAALRDATARWEAFRTLAVAADFPNLSTRGNRGPNLA